MSNVVLQNVTKHFKSVTALKDVSFSISDSEFFVLLGPTGAGKTTTLRVIAGLERQDEGSVLFDGQAVDGLPPADRDVAFVFQEYSLYPTMTVFDNLAFPLRSPLRRTSEAVIGKQVQETAEKLRITHLLNRKTAHLSGGEMQRVAIGRAIVRDPRLFLMDEPLSNLDAKLRESLRVELKHLCKTQGNTTLFVTHDQIEALTMGDRVAVLNQGRVVQIGTPEDIYDRPATTFVAQLVGTPRINLVKASREDGTLYVTGSAIHLPLPAGPTGGTPAPPQVRGATDDLSQGTLKGAEPVQSLPSSFLLGVRPEDVQPHGEGDFQGQLVLTEPLGVETILHIKTGEQTLLSMVPGLSDLRIGDQVRFNVVRERLHYFRPDGTRVK